MDKILATLQTTLQRWDLHPVVDHFTIGLLIIGVLIDLVASLAPTRTWLRYMALTLMVLGAIAAGASYFTGDIEYDRVANTISAPAKAVLDWHAKLGTYTAVVFGVLAVWRILLQGIGFFAGSRPVYLIFAIISASVLFYIGHLGGQMVYTYGVGTALMGSPATPTATPLSTPIANESLPTVSVPAATPTTLAPASPVAVPPTPAAPVPTATANGPSAY